MRRYIVKIDGGARGKKFTSPSDALARSRARDIARAWRGRSVRLFKQSDNGSWTPIELEGRTR